jgi:hypothetical protein
LPRRESAIIRYDGPALANHEMDIHDLAPALLALGDLCRLSNEILNGQIATVKVLVKADAEHKCFQLHFELVQTLYAQLTVLLDGEAVKDAKNILEWIGIVGGGVGASGVTLFGLYKKIFQENDPTQSKISVSTRDGAIVYQIVGDGNSIVVPPPVHQLASDPRILAATKKVLEPLDQDGYSKLEFENHGQIATYFSREEAHSILMAAPDAIAIDEGDKLKSTIKTSIRVRKAIYEGDAKWGFMYKKAIEAKIADHFWLSDFQAGTILVPPRSSLLVDLEETVPIDADGNQAGEPSYVVLKVHGVVPPPEQLNWLRDA